MSTDSEDSSTDKKRRRVIGPEGRRIIASVYHFLKDEYEFTTQFQEPNCDFSHLRNITDRTAEATGVCRTTVHRVLKEERGLQSTPSTNKKKKARKKKKHIEDTSEEDEDSQSNSANMHNTIDSKCTTDNEEEEGTIQNDIKTEFDVVYVKEEVSTDHE